MPSDVSSPLHLAAFLYRGANLPSSLQNLYVDDEVNRQTLGFLWDDQVAYYNYTARLKLCGQELSLPATHKEMIRPAKPPERIYNVEISRVHERSFPRAFGFQLALDPADNVGISYTLMECLPGKSYLEREIDATAEQKCYVSSQVADFMIELGKHPLSKAGSLAWRNEKPEISAIASNDFLVLDRYGPFDDALQYFKSIADQYLDLIADRYRQLSGTEK
ncbi:hypothetical protein CISG_07603 [Coccidioides immitis RMSCC 3703]|uniref:Uncharacterized protein n=1 Tax=Coccidioides immitis RMSCC 3703 TaxID=454286 RepID=A0A0J8R3L3_COCIT|nr:hypothetical protein CISG_07603 [Coccidioides immitis RMSCC 3703]